ncbi:hypothetical protein [Myxococcus landrumensis]|uniref:Glycosyltransferase RgtA/B/C/D-like domain-containing protein n=1 Tax=Myxococcus landrumensis TaxID=2813577 RepID=A0ABX7MYW4_9BACT|nr:hypothetical protein [Myxococcus landrumus]QSQ11481.1 hypothetical protein JY572_24085 [Myxococcus landrumus]
MKTSTHGLLRAAHRAASLTGVRLALFGALALAACWHSLSQAGGLNDFRDSHLLDSYEDASTRSVTDYGQLPLWNPWSCGGQYALGSPQTRSFAPTLVLSSLVGARRAEPLLLWTFLVLGMEGFFRYARRRVGSALGALGGAPLFGLISFTALSWSIGWLNFAGFLLLPWLLHGTWLATRGKLSGAAMVGGVFALLLGFGGTYPVPMYALFVALETGRSLYSLRGMPQRRRALWSLGLTACFTLAACAFRLWPLVETMRSAPRIMAGTPGKPLGLLVEMLLQLPARSGYSDPGNFYFAPVALVLVLPALVFARRRAAFPAIVAGLSAWMAAGYTVNPSLFAGLRQLPIFGTFRYPERFLVPTAFFLAELAALGLAVLLVRSWRSPARWTWAAVAACAVMLASWGLHVRAFDNLTRWAQMIPMPVEKEQPFAQARGNRWSQGHLLALNRGSIACFEAWPVPMSPRLRGDLGQEEYLEDPGSGTARRVEWTPNRLTIDVDATQPAVLLVNQNWHPGWKSAQGEVVSRDGLLGVQVPAGKHQVVLSFRPRSGIGGMMVSTLAWVALGFLAWRERRGQRLPAPAALGVTAVPLVTWGLLFTLWPEPVALPTPRNANGTPLTVAQLPPEARTVNARFELPVELVASEIPVEPDAEGIASLVLYWRVTGPLPRSVGIFVHVVSAEGLRLGADHEVVGGTWFFSEAPRDTLLRDAFSFSTRGMPHGEWKVLVGLWHSGGDQSRVALRSAEVPVISDGRVPVGAFTVPRKVPANESSVNP